MPRPQTQHTTGHPPATPCLAHLSTSRPRPLALAAHLVFLSGAIALSGWTSDTLAQGAATAQASRSYDIPAGPLSTVLTRFSREAGIYLVGDGNTAEGKTSPGLKGDYDVEAGFTALLRGTGLEAFQQADGSYGLRHAPKTPATAAPDDGATTTLPTVIVKSDASQFPRPAAGGQVAKGGRLGLLGNKSNLDAPFSTIQYTAKLIEDQQAQNVGDVLINDPAVRNTYPRGAGREEFNIRGFTLFNYDIAFNGLYGISPRNAASLIGIERVELLRGPNALLNGMSPYGSIGGAINLVPKRADVAPLNRFTLSHIDDSQLGVHADIGRRFGEEKAWGLRANVLRRSGDTPVEPSREELEAVTLGLDHQAERWRFEADVNFQDRTTHGRSGLLFPPAAGTRIGPAPDADRSFFPRWMYWSGKELGGVARTEIDLSPEWTAFVALGGMRYDFDSLQTSWLMMDDTGTLAARPYRLKERIDTITGETGLKGRVSTGNISHDVTLSISGYRLKHRSLRVASPMAVFSNLYSPQDITKPRIDIGSHIPKSSEIELQSVALADTISAADERLQLTLGVRHQRNQTSGFDGNTGARTAHYEKSATTPAIGVVFKPTDTWSFYGNYIEGLSQGPTAPSTASNAGEVFPPMKSKQIELGTKAEIGGALATFSVFQIERPSGLLDPSSLRYSIDGEQRNRGLELSVSGELAEGVRLLAGSAYTDGRLRKTASGTNDGRVAPATPRWQFNLGAEWDVRLVPGLTASARAVNTSKQYVDAGNTQAIPSWTRWDLGARYSMEAGGIPLTARLTVENVLGKDYWLSAAREGLTVGAPRTVLFSLSADL